jgi:hypothetical protein
MYDVSIVLFALTACYAFVPAAPGRRAVGGAIQLTLTDSGAAVLTPIVGPFVATLEGRLIEDSSATYILEVSKTTRKDGAETDWRGERVSIPHALVAT